MAKVMIVDDSATDRETMRMALEFDGHQVALVDSAEQSIEMARQSQPDLIVMDVVFEGMSGFQGTRKLHRDPLTSNIPIIMISSKSQESDRAWGLRQGAAEYLVKPVTPKLLRATVAQLLGQERQQ